MAEQQATFSAGKGMLYTLLVVAAVLRLHELTGFSLSNDELSALARLQFNSFREIIKSGVYPDFHPAGVQVFLYYWTSIFGFSEWVIRLPFALLGIGSVYLIYRIGKMWFGVPAGLLAGAALAVLQYPVLYSQIARPYSPGLFFSLSAVFFWTRIFFPSRDSKVNFSWTDIAGFILSVSACMYIHYFSFIFAGLVCMAGLFFLSRKNILIYLFSGVIILLLYIPHLDIFLHQLSKGGVGGPGGWLGPPKEDSLAKYLDYVFNDSVQLKNLFYVVLAGSIISYWKRISVTRFHVLSILFFAIPFAIAYYYSIYKNPVFQYSVLLFSFPFLLLFIFSFIPETENGTGLKIIFYSVLLGGIYSTMAEQKFYSTAHFSEFRGIAHRVKLLDEQYGKNNITKAINIFDPYYINYYLQKENHDAGFGIYSIMTPAERYNFSNLILNSNTPFFLYAYSNVYDDPQFDMMIRSRFPWLIFSDSLLRSGIRLYSNEKIAGILNRVPDVLYNYGFEKGEWANEIPFRDSVIKYEGKYSLHITPDVEYSATYTAKIATVSLLPDSKIELSAIFFARHEIKGARLVISIEKNGKTLLYESKLTELSGIHPGEWVREYISTVVPVGLEGDEDLKIYCWNEKHEELWMDDIQLKVYSSR
jgi:hypothetical protein